MLGHAVWFEIPTVDFERAVKFYESVFQVQLTRENIGGELAIFPSVNQGDQGASTGALVSMEGYAPTATGAVIYLDGGENLSPILERATKAGGRVATPKTALPPGMGFFAHFIDSEGNRVGVHSMN